MKKILLLLLISFGLSSFAYAQSEIVPISINVNEASALSVPEKNLSFGKTGIDVVALQNILIAKGYLSANLNTGYFGAKTKVALMKLQKENGIPAIGMFGPMTRSYLKKMISVNTGPIGGQTDSHDCLVGAGYSWDNTSGTCVRPWEKLSNMLTREWVLQNVDTKAYDDLTFKVMNESVVAKACNNIFGKIIIDDLANTVSAPALASTLMACSDNRLMYQDSVLSQVLSGTAKVNFDLNANPVTMTIIGSGHTLVFVQK